MRAKTIGFAIADQDRELLERLSEHYGKGNRSEFLRVAMRKMEHERLADQFRETQQRARAELSGKVFSDSEVLELIANIQAS
jgi:Arc/MetJ-type ribon-helix-helix transcriptional regulator